MDDAGCEDGLVGGVLQVRAGFTVSKREAIVASYMEKAVCDESQAALTWRQGDTN